MSTTLREESIHRVDDDLHGSVAESGAMVGMTPNVQLQTQSGGVMSGLKRMFGGESSGGIR
jgi:uncharacterized protein (AIM24 family)